jgi:PAS domain S-box-containing protein
MIKFKPRITWSRENIKLNRQTYDKVPHNNRDIKNQASADVGLAFLRENLTHIIERITSLQEIAEGVHSDDTIAVELKSISNKIEQVLKKTPKHEDEQNQELQGNVSFSLSREFYTEMPETFFEGIALHWEGCIISSNRTFAEIFGYSPGEIPGVNISDLLLPESRVILKECLTGHCNCAYEIECYKKQGSAFTAEIISKNVKHLDKNIQIITIKDVTGEKNIREEKHKLLRAVEQSTSIIMITDSKGLIEYVNPRFTNVTGYEIDEVIGRNPNFLKSGLMSQAAYKEMWKTISSGREWQGVFPNKKKTVKFTGNLQLLPPSITQRDVL